MRAFPQVKIWGAWNEPDNGQNPLHPLAKAEKAAFLWQEAQRAASNVGCKCTVVAGEFKSMIALRLRIMKRISPVM